MWERKPWAQPFSTSGTQCLIIHRQSGWMNEWMNEGCVDWQDPPDSHSMFEELETTETPEVEWGPAWDVVSWECVSLTFACQSCYWLRTVEGNSRGWDGATLGKPWVSWMRLGLGLRTQYSHLEMKIALEVVSLVCCIYHAYCSRTPLGAYFILLLFTLQNFYLFYNLLLPN